MLKVLLLRNIYLFCYFPVLRTWLGLISLVPNLLPAIMGFGLWGYSVGSVTLAVSIVVANPWNCCR